MGGPEIFKLTKPIKVHGTKGSEDIRELTLREPIFDDTREIPDLLEDFVLPDGRRKYQWDHDASARWIARLSGKSVGEIGALAVCDARKMRDWIIDVMGGKPEEGSPAKNS